MLNPNTYRYIKKKLENGTFCLVRLMKKKGEGEYVCEIGYNNPRLKLEGAIAKLNYIREKCNNAMPPGEYCIECRVHANNKSLVEEFPFTIIRTIIINPDGGVDNKTNEQETMQPFDWDDYKKLIEENANLKAQLTQLQFENAWIKEHGVKQAALADGAPPVKDGMQMIAESLGEALPGIFNIADKYFERENKRLDIEDKKVDSGLIRKKNSKLMPVKRKKEKTYEEALEEEAQYFDSLNDDEFEAEMSALETEDPEFYADLCDYMGIEEDGEEQGDDDDDKQE